VALAIEADEVSLSIEQAVPAGLILNELLTNAFKYAFPRPAEADTISVSLHGTGEGMVEMSVGDNGAGIPEGIGPDAAATLGISLVYILASQLGGELRLERGGGTRFTLAFRLR
jgi:two-component sensor histidine kinase